MNPYPMTAMRTGGDRWTTRFEFAGRSLRRGGNRQFPVVQRTAGGDGDLDGPETIGLVDLHLSILNDRLDECRHLTGRRITKAIEVIRVSVVLQPVVGQDLHGKAGSLADDRLAFDPTTSVRTSSP